ncbi:MAG: SPFH domain-containing protein [Blautia sp.]|nr:SPFH domain-containing protein [Blautia sp.]
MGLIRAGVSAVTSTIGDLWKEYFYCDALDNDVLVVKGRKKTGHNMGSDNVITNGSGIVVADGQCMIIVEQGKIVEVCAEPGEFTYDTSSEPSVFGGSLSESIAKTFEIIGKRFTYGGDAAMDQRVYYFNTKELMGNKFGTANPIPFRVTDQRIGLDVDVSVRCNGTYSYRIADPLLFYANVCGNVAQAYVRSDIDMTLRSEFVSALQPAFAELSHVGLRPSDLPAHVGELCQAMNSALTRKWGELRGLEIVSIAINSVTLPEEDANMIKDAQKNAMYRDPGMAAAMLAGAQADAMKAAASNANGAMAGFMGMGMAQQAGGVNVQNLYAMGAQQQQQAAQTQAAQAQPAADTWTCSCGSVNKGKFCPECGQPKPAASAITYRCSKCGWVPDDPANPPKFCPECGDPINYEDVVK